MTEPGEGRRPPAGPPGVSVAWRSAAVREVAGSAADKLAADGVPAALTAKDPDLWGPDAATEAAIRLGWLDAPRVSRALLSPLAELASGVFLQITGVVTADVPVPVPGRDFTLGRLQLARALGDLGAPRQRSRPSVWLRLRDRAAGLRQVLDAARASATGQG